MRFVIDASVAVRWFLRDETHPNAEAVLQHLVRVPECYAVPELFCFEVPAVLLRVHPNPGVIHEGLVPLLQGGMLRYPMTDELAALTVSYVAKGLTGYDAAYAGLAEMLNAQWLTFDRRAHRMIAEAGYSMDLEYDLPDLAGR